VISKQKSLIVSESTKNLTNILPTNPLNAKNVDLHAKKFLTLTNISKLTILKKVTVATYAKKEI